MQFHQIQGVGKANSGEDGDNESENVQLAGLRLP
jgi:hypothetical protein